MQSKNQESFQFAGGSKIIKYIKLKNIYVKLFSIYLPNPFYLIHVAYWQDGLSDFLSYTHILIILLLNNSLVRA
jgi:hypothetical protein